MEVISGLIINALHTYIVNIDKVAHGLEDNGLQALWRRLAHVLLPLAQSLQTDINIHQRITNRMTTISLRIELTLDQMIKLARLKIPHERSLGFDLIRANMEALANNQHDLQIRRIVDKYNTLSKLIGLN